MQVPAAPTRDAAIPSPGSKDEVVLLHRDSVIEVDREVGLGIAVHITVDEGVGRSFDITELASAGGESCTSDELEGLVASEQGIGVDQSRIDVICRCEVEDRVPARAFSLSTRSVLRRQTCLPRFHHRDRRHPRRR